MTYRERREARAERLRGWAATRQNRAAAVFKAGEPFTSDIAFNTQPGHIPFRARLIAREERAYESTRKAASMESRADGIDAQLEHAIYSDDPDAIERLEERIRDLEAERERMKAANVAYRREHRVDLAGMTLYQREQVLPHAGYELSNLGGNLSRNRQRLATLKAQHARTAQAEQAGGVTIEGADDERIGAWVRITFAEKPSREILDSLKAAGFRWGGGSWMGPKAAIPAGVRGDGLAHTATPCYCDAAAGPHKAHATC